MLRLEVRNRRTKTSLGIVTIENPEDVLEALADSTGCTVDDIIQSLGKTAKAAKEALELVEVGTDVPQPKRKSGNVINLPRRSIFGV